MTSIKIRRPECALFYLQRRSVLEDRRYIPEKIFSLVSGPRSNYSLSSRLVVPSRNQLSLPSSSSLGLPPRWYFAPQPADIEFQQQSYLLLLLLHHEQRIFVRFPCPTLNPFTAESLLCSSSTYPHAGRIVLVVRRLKEALVEQTSRNSASAHEQLIDENREPMFCLSGDLNKSYRQVLQRHGPEFICKFASRCANSGCQSLAKCSGCRGFPSTYLAHTGSSI